MGSCKFEEQRIAPRERLSLSLKLRDGSQALTRDISATGLFFEMEGEHLLSGLVDFEMEVPEARVKFVSTGEIVRLEHSPGRTGVAVRLLAPRLEPIE